ncbi:helix-hairpin-helix domain-containing protein [Rubritalea profundi]|uniref:helix-hairpin-helix domain-containing protein n=1 Tax=Rubritalea profundi TaxID=1658618 RepID=UPI0019814D45|nr:helix-hairpin-helix domain-containing protein [Rubritalea profundi]
MNSREATIALNMLPKIGPIRVRRLLERLGSAEAILKAGESQLTQSNGIGPETARIISQWEQHIDLSKELDDAKLGASPSSLKMTRITPKPFATCTIPHSRSTSGGISLPLISTPSQS